MSAARRIALGVEYDGRAYCGWEAQRGQPTVQAVLERALSAVAARPVRTVCAGRTDARVHASGQVVHLDSEAPRDERAWVHGTNAHLPADVRVQWARVVGAAFHARFSARARTYRYLIFNRRVRPALYHGRATWEYRPLDAERMQAGADYLLGEHDFSAYRARACQARSAVRTVYRLEVQRRGALVIIEVCANAFLHHMVRNIAGVLCAIGAGEREPRWAGEVLEGRERARGGVTAPPDGLYLAGVEYPARFGLPPLPPSPLLW